MNARIADGKPAWAIPRAARRSYLPLPELGCIVPSKTSAAIIKADLAAVVRDELPDLTHRDTTDLVDTVVETIVETLEDGEDVLVTGFGRWKVTAKEERPGRNPATGGQVTISASDKSGPVEAVG